MSDLRTAALRALEALESVQPQNMGPLIHPAITALREALVEDAMQKFTDVNQEIEAALAEPWPVGVVTSMVKGGVTWHIWPDQMADGTTLYAAAPIIQPEIKDDKPFGYFRAEPFGWTDCAPTDEGAIPLYERPQQPSTPPEAQTEAEKVAYCAGWWAAMETKREQK